MWPSGAGTAGTSQKAFENREDGASESGLVHSGLTFLDRREPQVLGAMFEEGAGA